MLSMSSSLKDLTMSFLCGSSYAGLVISGVADLISERIAALVYLDAWVPEDGDSMFTLLPESSLLSIIKEVKPYEGYMRPAITAEASEGNERDRAWVGSMRTPHHLRTMTEEIRLHGNHRKGQARLFPLAAGAL